PRRRSRSSAARPPARDRCPARPRGRPESSSRTRGGRGGSGPPHRPPRAPRIPCGQGPRLPLTSLAERIPDRCYGRGPGAGAPLEMKIAIGSDHAGFELKQKVAPWLEGSGHEVVDVGTGSDESTDYPLYAAS